MNKRQNQRGDQMIRIIQFVLDHTITPSIPRASTLLTELENLHERFLDFGSDQEGGGNIFRSGSAQRRALRNEILFAVTEISGTARALDPTEHPGIRDLFRLNDSDKSYQRLVNTCSSFVEHLATPAVKALFTDRGFEADFDADLTVKLSAFAAATGTKYQGRQTQKAGTVGLEALSRRAVVVIRELSAIVVKYLRRTNPLLVPVWEAAARAYVPAVASPQPAASIDQFPRADRVMDEFASSTDSQRTEAVPSDLAGNTSGTHSRVIRTADALLIPRDRNKKGPSPTFHTHRDLSGELRSNAQGTQGAAVSRPPTSAAGSDVTASGRNA